MAHDKQIHQDLLNRGRPLTKPERNARQRERMRSLIATEVLSRGDGCEWPGCQVTHPVQWHHLDPKAREFRIMNTRSLHKSYEAMEAELAKCKLLCEGHHMLDHAYLLLGMDRPW